MEQKFKDYLRGIGVTDSIINRIETVYSEVKDLFSIDIEQIFVNNIKDGTGEIYTSLWCVNKEFVIECKNFLNDLKYDIVSLEHTYYVQIEKFDNCSEESQQSMENRRVNMNVFLGNNLYCSFTAVGKNYEYLITMAKSYFLPLIINK